MIWELALGGLRLHILQCSHQRLGHMVCPLDAATTPSKQQNGEKIARSASDPFCEICQGSGIPQPVKESDLSHHQERKNLLGLALTCRQMYV